MPAVGAVNTPVLGLYLFPTFVMTTGNTRVPLFQVVLVDDTEAVNPTLFDTSTKGLYNRWITFIFVYVNKNKSYLKPKSGKKS